MKTIVGSDSRECKRMDAAQQEIVFNKQTWNV